MIAPGSTVDQKYWVERVIGRGGMGVVVAATHLQLGQRVALKFLSGDASYDPEAVARFLREARSAVRLRSEHVGRVIDVGTHDDAPYIVMEFLDGEDLSSLLTRGGPLPVATAVDLVLQACLGLAEAHAARIVHRDLKPANLFLTRRPDGTALLKVMDFGIAKAHGTLHAELTSSSAVMGSPGYMSPEQLRSARDVDARSDLWSLGVVLYELVTGRRPYVADSVTAMAVKIATEPPAPLPATIPRPFADTVMRCLAREPARRFADVAALARALAPSGTTAAPELAASVARVLAGSGSPATGQPAPVHALMDASTVSRAVAVTASTTSGADTLPYLPRRSAFWIGIAAGVVAVAIIVVTVAALRHPAAREPVASTAIELELDAGAPPTTIDAGRPSQAAVAPTAVLDAGVAAAVTAVVGAGPVTHAAAATSHSERHGRHAGASAALDAGVVTGDVGAPVGAVAPKPCVPTPEDSNCDGIPDVRL